MMRDFGHLDDESIEQMVLALADASGDREKVIDLPSVRRMAAAILYARDPDFAEAGGPLAEDWAFLFQ
jgi:hypothetical protein